MIQSKLHLPSPNIDIESDHDNQRVYCRSIGVDFPPHDEEPMVERKLENTRLASLKALESAIEEIVQQPLPLCNLPEESSAGLGILNCLREFWPRVKYVACCVSMCTLVWCSRLHVQRLVVITKKCLFGNATATMEVD